MLQLNEEMLEHITAFLPPRDTLRLQRTDQSTKTKLKDIRFAPSSTILTASADYTAKLGNVETGKLSDRMESFFLAETTKVGV